MKSLILPVVLACALPAGLASAQWLPAAPELPGKDGALKYLTASGRFQVFVSPQAKETTFMLDTETGRVWIMKKDHTSGDFSMQRVPVADLDATRKTPGDKDDPGVKKPSSGTESKK